MRQCQRISAVFALLAASLCGTLSADDRPNVLMIVIDDLNDWVGPLGGHPQVKTPAIDALAKRGLTFANAHCQAPLCNASRTSFLLSRRPSSTGVYALGPYFRAVPTLADDRTILQHFHDHGYETYCVGKVFHSAGAIAKAGMTSREADHFGAGQNPDPMMSPKLSGTHPIDGKIVDWGIVDHAMSERCDWKSADWAVEHLRSRGNEKPFFMACGFYLPHVPIYTTKKWHDLYPEATLKLPKIVETDRDDCSPFAWNFIYRDPYPKTDWLIENHQLSALVRAYLAAISFTDSQVARVLGALRESGHADDTIVLLFSDHGFHCGEKGVSGKHSLWEESTRVPLIISGPGIRGDQRCDEPVELLDVYPTLSELAGLETPDFVEGLSLMPQIVDPTTPRTRPAICTNSPHNHSVRDRRWRYIRYADGSEELYDCVADPGEHDNLIRMLDRRNELRDIVDRLRSWLPDTNAQPVAGSVSKMVTRRDGRWYYEDTLIEPSSLDEPFTN